MAAHVVLVSFLFAVERDNGGTCRYSYVPTSMDSWYIAVCPSNDAVRQPVFCLHDASPKLSKRSNVPPSISGRQGSEARTHIRRSDPDDVHPGPLCGEITVFAGKFSILSDLSQHILDPEAISCLCAVASMGTLCFS
ncbi:hypothetical protein K449DRAFT_143375 [Hypoxylon sp. EC38]|nr:hypothetical protein K449DRAFT_143375 [Hypoxylon sp. EC38]